MLIGFLFTSCNWGNDYEVPPLPSQYETVAAMEGYIPSTPLFAPIMELEGYDGFPSLHIASHYDPFTVERDFWHDGAITLWGTDEFDFENIDVRIRGRGNSTWVRGTEKRPLRLRFPEARTMFGSEYAHREWILLANLFDPGILRNHSALYLASMLDNLDFTPSSQFVHLYVNGEYMGLYQLTDERNPEPGRAPLIFDPDPALSEYMFELDGHLVGWRADEFEMDVDFFIAGIGDEERAYDIRFPNQSDWDGHLEYLRDHVQYVDRVIRSRDLETISRVIDIPSFVDFYLVQEFMKNIDVASFSVFMTLRGQGDERRIHFGPVWDFDRSAGNTLYWTPYTHIFAGWRNNWFRHLMSTPGMFEIVAARWDEIKDVQVRQMIDHITFITENYDQSFERNFERHNHILGGNPPWFVMLPQETREIDTFEGQVEYLLEWYEGRHFWLTAFFERRYDWINDWWDNIVAQPPQGPSFPSISITTYYNPFTVEREFWHSGTLSVSGAALGLNFEPVETRFRGRGNSTWRNGADKRPLRIRFEEPRPMLGSDYAATDWILLADFFDRSLLRNYSALHLGNLLSGLDFTPTPHHVHLYVNGEYMGVYILTDERDVNPGRMQLVWDEDPALSDFFLELDHRAHSQGILNDTFVNINGLAYDIRYPGNRSRRTPEHVAYVDEYLHRVSYAVRQQGFDEAIKLIDLDSFIDFYLVHELFKEYDVVNQLSIFMHIRGQGDERRLFMGPIWDFDLAAGNVLHQQMGRGPEYLYVALFNYWYRYLMQMPEFFDAVVARWNEIVDEEIAQMINHVRQLAQDYQTEFERNFERHQILGVAVPRIPAPQAMIDIEDHPGHVVYLLNWLELRVSWLDDFFNGRIPGHDPLWVLVEYHTNHSPIAITVNGVEHELNLSLINLQNRVMVHINELENIFGLDVSYNPETGIVSMSRRGISIAHRVGDLFMAANMQRIDMDVPGSLYIGEYLFIPLRTIAEILGYDIRWSVSGRRVVLSGG